MNETTLQHWGIKGMKWGVRRYQNKDGSLTALGRKREKEMNDKLKSSKKEIEQLKKENEALKKNAQSSKPKNPSEMTDEELRERVNRLSMENQYKTYMKNLHPETKSKGQKFVDKLVGDVLVPAAIEVGKNTAKSIMTNMVKSAFESTAKAANKDKDKDKDT